MRYKQECVLVETTLHCSEYLQGWQIACKYHRMRKEQCTVQAKLVCYHCRGPSVHTVLILSASSLHFCFLDAAVDVVRKCGAFPVGAWARLPLLTAFTSPSRLASFTVLLSYDLFHQPYLSIFRVSRAVQQEAEHLYFSANTFVQPSKWHFMSLFGEGAPPFPKRP